MEEFVNDHGVTGFDHIADEETEIWSAYEVTSQPAWVFINDDGSRETLVSALGRDGLTERVEGLIAS